MKLWLQSRWENTRTSFWFVPTLMVVAAIALSLSTISLDRATAEHSGVATLGWTFTRGPEGSRALLSVVAGSMMTIASVTFSITIVALQLASSQFGPRLLRNFMRDRGNQVAIGTFIATFTYCLLVLRTVNGTESSQFVPHISVTVGLVLSLASIGVLIYFIHHSAESIQAENVIAGVSRDLHDAIERLYPAGVGQCPRESPGRSVALPERFDLEARRIPSRRSEYLQAIDLEKLMRLAKERDLILVVDQRPGQFFFKGGSLVRAWPAERVDEGLADLIRGSFYFGAKRTLTQDVEFGIDQLVEIAVRALPAGINDPFTAINCIDRLGAALCTLAERDIPSPFRLDEAGRLRIVADISTVPGLIDASFHQIRQGCRTDASVTMRLLETIGAVARNTDNPEFHRGLRRHAEFIFRGSQEGLADLTDRQDAEKRYREAVASLEGAGGTAGSPGA